jgi:hypothetical protein
MSLLATQDKIFQGMNLVWALLLPQEEGILYYYYQASRWSSSWSTPSKKSIHSNNYFIVYYHDTTTTLSVYICRRGSRNCPWIPKRVWVIWRMTAWTR